jgi:hypothetical protein
MRLKVRKWEGRPYLTELTLFSFRPFRRELFAIRIVKRIASDPEGYTHRHAYPFISICLSGGYGEIRPYLHMPEAVRDRRPFSISFRFAYWQDNHHVIIFKDKPMTSLVICGPTRRARTYLKGLLNYFGKRNDSLIEV